MDRVGRTSRGLLYPGLSPLRTDTMAVSDLLAIYFTVACILSIIKALLYLIKGEFNPLYLIKGESSALGKLASNMIIILSAIHAYALSSRYDKDSVVEMQLLPPQFITLSDRIFLS